MEVKEETKVTPEELRGTVDYLSEINVLKRTPRLGWRVAGPSIEEESDNDAGHISEVAQIAYILGRMEGLNIPKALKCVALATFHENAETRLADRDKITSYYSKVSKKEFLMAMEDQTAQLSKEIGKEILEFATEANFGDNQEAIIVRDADSLEASIQAKIFYERGLLEENVLNQQYLHEGRFQTNSAKRLVNALRRRKDLAIRWWRDLPLSTKKSTH